MKFAELYNTILLLEKDNRPKILKLGIPQDVADYLHGLNDKYSLWFADKIARMPDYQTARDKFRYVHSLQTHIQGIIDWIRGAQNIPINNYDWEAALSASREWHEKLTISDITQETNTILKKYEDGFYWVDLESSSDTCEKDAMGHCATTSKGDTLYSLRKYNKSTNGIESFITIAVSPDEGKWFQCKGRKNSKPKPEYHRYIVDILVSKDIYTFKTEYDSTHDFKPKDFIQYLEENPDAYPDNNEIIEKIQTNEIGFDNFEKILNNYRDNFKHFDIYLDDDREDSDSISTMYSFYLEIKKDSTDLPIECLDFSAKSAIRYMSDICDVYFTNIDVEERHNDNNVISIRGDIEDDDSHFSMDEQGLVSFERQCKYYEELNEKFDLKEFMSEKLEKVLILDGCIEHSGTEIKTRVEKELTNIFNTKLDYNSYNLVVDTKTQSAIPVAIDFDKCSSSSTLRNFSDSVVINSSWFDGETDSNIRKNGDLLLLVIFWDFVKKNILTEYSKQMTVNLDKRSKRFIISFKYDFDEEYDVEREMKYLVELSKSLPEIQKAYTKYYSSIIEPFLNTAKILSPEDFTLEPTSYDPNQVHIYADGRFFGIRDKAHITPEVLKDIAKERHLRGTYDSIDQKKIRIWLNNEISRQPEFNNFVEQIIKKLK